MLFNSYPFVFGFLPLTFATFFLFARWKKQAAMVCLAVASVAFYAWWSVKYVPLLLFSVFFNFVIARLVVAGGKKSGRKPKRALLWAGVLGDLALLGYYKYTAFFIHNVDTLFGLNWTIGEVILPLGISFFTFTQIAFLIDAYRGEAEVNAFSRYLLFVTYFPHLLAGPIIHHKQVMPQFQKPSTYRISYSNLAAGFSFFTIGLAKKVLIADQVAPVANALFSAHGAPPMTAAWIGTVAYTLQLYFDFSGYSDMAIGLSRMFNIDLPINFNSPYKSVSIIDFWRRWHMTLSAFLRDYLYIPLGGNRKGLIRRYLNLCITMLLGGLWHGAGWTFVIWGGLHGLFLAINHLWRAAVPNRCAGTVEALCYWALTSACVAVAWVFFRAPDGDTAFRIVAGLFGFDGLGLHKAQFSAAFSAPPNISDIGILAAALAAVWLLPNSQEIVAALVGGHRQPKSAEPARLFIVILPQYSRIAPRAGWSLSTNGAIAAGVTAGVLLFICIARLNHVSEFIYYQF